MTIQQQAAAELSVAPPAIPARGRGAQARKWLEIGIFVGPALVVFLTFVILPVALAAVYSLYNWNGLTPLERFIGFDNYVRALSDPLFLTAIGNNFTILIASLLVQGPLAIAIALLLNRKLRGRAFIRAAIFVPYVLAEVIAGLSWKLLLSPAAVSTRCWRRSGSVISPSRGSPIPTSPCG
ncbi:carbohydrate ABC transporter permease [Microbacterium sp. NIBRBAC000506063]|uniref:carbohydrate ABC transporter permease n=1 Tax=Microbacterium sp. NIBRBAC000506063 TaxID=2734618 RepID=UPI001CB70766|nr:sugar ABC transporter permease [Microbacterium sp. NIBRBAC000506063]